MMTPQERLDIFAKAFIRKTPDLIERMGSGERDFVPVSPIEEDFGLFSNPLNSFAKLCVSKSVVNGVDIESYVSAYAPSMTRKMSGQISAIQKFMESGELSDTDGVDEDGVIHVYDEDHGAVPGGMNQPRGPSGLSVHVGADEPMPRQGLIGFKSGNFSEDDMYHPGYASTEKNTMFLGMVPFVVSVITLPFSVPSAVVVKGRMTGFNDVPVEFGDKKVHMYVNEGVDDMVGFLMASPSAVEQMEEFVLSRKMNSINFAGDKIYISSMMDTRSVYSGPDYGLYVRNRDINAEKAAGLAQTLTRSVRPSRAYAPDVSKFLGAWNKNGNRTLALVIAALFGIPLLLQMLGVVDLSLFF